MAEGLFSSQGSTDVVTGSSCDMKEIIAMWDPQPGDNSLGPDFRKGSQEVASLEQKFECAKDMLLQRTSSSAKRDYSVLMGGEGSRQSLELNGGTPKMLKSDSSKDSLGKGGFSGLLAEGSTPGFERNGFPGSVNSESSRSALDRGVNGGPTSFAGLFMQPPMLPGTGPLGVHVLRPPPPLQAIPPFPRVWPPPLGRTLPLSAPLPPRILPCPSMVPPLVKPEYSGSISIDSERSSDGPCMSADPSVHGTSIFRRLESKDGGERDAVPAESKEMEEEKGGDPDPQKTQREKNMLKSRRHRLRKKAQETLLKEKIGKLEAELAGVRGELNRVAAEGRREVSRLQEENVRLRTELGRRASAPLRNGGPAPSRGNGNQAEKIESLQAENRTLKEGYRNVLATMNELMQTKAS